MCKKKKWGKISIFLIVMLLYSVGGFAQFRINTQLPTIPTANTPIVIPSTPAATPTPTPTPTTTTPIPTSPSAGAAGAAMGAAFGAAIANYGKSIQRPVDVAQAQKAICDAAALNGTMTGQTAKDCQANNTLVGAATDAAETTGSTFIDVTYLLQHIQSQVPQLVRFIVALSYVSGIAFFFMALMKLKQKGMQTVMSSSGNEGIKAPVVYIFVGSALLYFPSFVNVATNTLMGSGGGDSMYGYSSAAASGFGVGYESLFVTMVAIVRLVGYISFLRGWYLLAKMGGHSSQPGQTTKGMVHIIGGVLAINIVSTYQIVKATLGLVF